jgi:hypothetical protein
LAIFTFSENECLPKQRLLNKRKKGLLRLKHGYLRGEKNENPIYYRSGLLFIFPYMNLFSPVLPMQYSHKKGRENFWFISSVVAL